jgi:ribosomal protein S18 acetylase RimI-like enzyme
VKIRPYRKEDKPAIEQICISSILQGELDKNFDTKDLFVKIWISAYLNGQSKDSIVVEDQGKVVGYLICSVNCSLLFIIRIIFIFIREFLIKNKQSIKCLFDLMREISILKNGAHFQLNLKNGYKSQKIGHKLIHSFEKKCKEKNITQWYTIVFAHSSQGSLRFYERLGLRVFRKKQIAAIEDLTIVYLVKRIT